MANWSATGSINGNFRLELNVWENWVNNAENYSSVHWEVILRSTGAYNFQLIGSTIAVNVDGEVYNAYSQKNLSAGGAITIASGDKNIWHNTDGSKSIYCSASYTQTSSAYYTPGNMSCGGDMWLTHIPRYANFTQHYVQSKSMNTVSIYWNADASCDYIQYSINGGGWTNISGHPTYTVSNLQPNTNYSIKTRIRRADSGLWTESGTLSFSTLDMARLTNFNSNLKLGEDYNYSYTNPSNAKVEIGIYEIDGNTPIVEYKEYTKVNGVLNLTEEEIKLIYKKINMSNTYNARIYIRSTQNGSSSWNWKDINIKLTGKVKTVTLMINGILKKGIVWVGTSAGNKAGVFTVGTSNGNRRGS